jgi:hypothetical protein
MLHSQYSHGGNPLFPLWELDVYTRETQARVTARFYAEYEYATVTGRAVAIFVNFEKTPNT